MVLLISKSLMVADLADNIVRSRPPCVVHMDLDGYSDICRVHGWRFSGSSDVVFESGLRNALDFFEQRGIRACLFTIAQDLQNPAKKELLQEAVRRGHAIGSHTVTHRSLTSLPSNEKTREIFDSRQMLQDTLGVPVDGFRAPGFFMDSEALRAVEGAGYRFDSSLFPDVRSALRVQVAAVPVVPHSPTRAGRLLELPMPAFAPLPLPFHASYSLVLGNWYFKLGVGEFSHLRVPLVMLFHLTDFSNPVPGAELPNWKAKLYTLSFLDPDRKTRRCGEMLRFVERYYRIVPTTELLQHEESYVEEELKAGNPA